MPEMPGPVLPSVDDLSPTAGAAAGDVAAAIRGGNVLQGIDAAAQGEGAVVDLEFSQPLDAPPAVSTLRDPIRLVLDFPGTSARLAAENQTLRAGPLQAASVVQDRDKTRVILELDQTTRYSTVLQGRSLRVTLTPLR
jgi:type IV pilus assembly protein PilQ